MRPSVLTMIMLATAILAQQTKTTSTKPTVVFVCEHGSAKSIIAAAEFERMAKEKGLNLNILARGTNPDAEITKLVRDGLEADGYDVGNLKPTKDFGEGPEGCSENSVVRARSQAVARRRSGGIG